MGAAQNPNINHNAYDDNTCEFVATFPFYGREPRKMIMQCSPQQFIAGWGKYSAGAMAQNAFPFLSADEREFIISGTYPDEWERMTGGFDR